MEREFANQKLHHIARLHESLSLDSGCRRQGHQKLVGILAIALVIFPGVNNFIQAPFWLLSKIFVFLFVYVWMRGTLPRLRYDQLMAFGWKMLLPVSIANVVLTSFAILRWGAIK